MATTPIRSVKIGSLWVTGQEFATMHGVTMTALVELALERVMADPETPALIAERKRQLVRTPRIRSRENAVLVAVRDLARAGWAIDDLDEVCTQLAERPSLAHVDFVRAATPPERREAIRVLDRLLAVWRAA